MNLGEIRTLLDNSKFYGQGFGKYYPAGSTAAYYMMKYSPNRLTILHKSPSSPTEEQIVAQYKDGEVERIDAIVDGKTRQLYPGEIDQLQILVKYLFLDPRIILRCVDDVNVHKVDETHTKYELLVLDADMIKVICEMMVESDSNLTQMRLRKFLNGAEIHGQTMTVEFEYPESQIPAR